MFAKKRILTLAVTAALSMSMLLSSCTSTNQPTASSTPTSSGDATSSGAVTTAKGNFPGTAEKGAITANLSTEPPELFTVTSQDSTSADVLRHIVAGLVSLDQDDRPAPEVAEKWDISADGLVYTFHLNKNYKWTNGEPVTAKDFEFAMKLLLGADKAVVAPYNYFGFFLKNGEGYSNFVTGVKNAKEVKWEDVGVKVIDDYTLEYTLENPTAFFLTLQAFPTFLPLNEKGYNDVKAKGNYATDADKLITNGAFKITSWTHEDSIVMEKNADYPKADNIKLNKVTYKMYKDSNAAVNAFRSGELDIIGLNNLQATQMRSENQPISTFMDGAVSYLQFNCEHPALKNKKIRQALAYAIDSENFVKNILSNSSIAATSFTAPCINGKTDKFIDEVGKLFTPHDLEKAKTLLAEGLKEVGMDKLDLTFITDDTDAALKYSAFIQENLKNDLGIGVTIETMPFKNRIQRMNDQDFDVAMALWGPDYNDPTTYLDMWETGNGNNNGKFSSAKYDELLNQARVETDATKRFDILMEAEKVLMDEMAIAPYYFRAVDYTTSNKLQGVVRTAFQNFNFCFASTAE